MPLQANSGKLLKGKEILVVIASRAGRTTEDEKAPLFHRHTG
jgi:hypothetical protein